MTRPKFEWRHRLWLIGYDLEAAREVHAANGRIMRGAALSCALAVLRALGA